MSIFRRRDYVLAYAFTAALTLVLVITVLLQGASWSDALMVSVSMMGVVTATCSWIWWTDR